MAETNPVQLQMENHAAFERDVIKSYSMRKDLLIFVDDCDDGMFASLFRLANESVYEMDWLLLFGYMLNYKYINHVAYGRAMRAATPPVSFEQTGFRRSKYERICGMRTFLDMFRDNAIVGVKKLLLRVETAADYEMRYVKNGMVLRCP